MKAREPLEPPGSAGLLDTVVAGMTCRDVLHRLNDFLDGDLSPQEVGRVTAHLAGCRTCEQFGGRVGALIASLRAGGDMLAADGIPPGAAERLRARLAAGRR